MNQNGNGVPGFPSLTATSTMGFGGSSMPLEPSRAGHKDAQRIIDEWHKQTLVIDTQARKTVFGISKIGEIHQHAAPAYNDTVNVIMQIKNERRSKEHQAIIDGWSTHQVQLLTKHFSAAIDTGATNIGYEIYRSLYPPPAPRSLWQRIFGGG